MTFPFLNTGVFDIYTNLWHTTVHVNVIDNKKRALIDDFLFCDKLAFQINSQFKSKHLK